MPTRSDAWLAAGLVVASVAAALLTGSEPPHRPTDAVSLAFAVLSAFSLLWRTTAPVSITAVTGTVVVLNAAAGYPPTVVQWPAWIAVFTVFATYGWRMRLAGGLITFVALVGYVLFDRNEVGSAELFSISMSFLISMVAGEATRARRFWAEASQARLLAEERTRLARELHDALGHAVNVIVMQAGVGRRVFADNPEFAQAALGHIETVGRDALGELDRLLRVMHSDDDSPPDLGELAARVRAAGRDLRLNTSEVDLAPGAARAVHRIIQEAVTNALRHTETGRIDVDLAQVGDRVVLEVANEGRHLAAPTPGRGLVNMRERARLEGGEFEAGPVDGGFLVRATLPARSTP
ncbi:histidine kinase [Actinosynnema sp. NPDC047251]|uniref:histidine kinase n=1 Tax=Saccharothrix espanaensis (strain ATCC 51144 / DSM 44229 / JCM 9112 / NBRC 15066 / NRRL 15764) TaxID=1179773 RepID=K0K9Z7_SACES|nr:histidine kinase [Saccharothrix espanaensis]CCH34372.1 Integral membrane sensor signal transduction histidine kinase [Saccharothrix espanaensis DSM 44229]